MSELSASQSIIRLRHLLRVGGWQSRKAAIAEAMPHLTEHHGLDELAQTLENLGIPHRLIRCRERDITSGETPALIVFEDGTSRVLHAVEDGKLVLESPELGTAVNQQAELEYRQAKPVKCSILQIEAMKGVIEEKSQVAVSSVFDVLTGMFPSLLFASFISNLLGLTTPLLIMVIYDRVIPSSSTSLLVALGLGVILIISADFSFRRLRSRALSYTGSKSELDLTLALFRKLMSLPLSQMERSSVEQQLSRFRQFEGMRDVFTGQIMAALLDVPFAILFLGVLYWLAPEVAFFVFGTIVALALLAILWVPKQQRLDAAASEASVRLSSVVTDAVQNQKALVNLGLGELWQERAQERAEESEQKAAVAQDYRTLMTTAAQSLIGLTTVSAILLSTYGALEGDLSFGALLAIITLSSKILSPFHSLFGSLPQIVSSNASRKQADRLLSLSEEKELGLWHFHQKTLQGEVRFNGVTYRPDPLNAPVLSQVSFKVNVGETVVVMGSDLIGRASILDLVDGLYDPLLGNIEHDGIDIRQIAKDELRRSIAYCHSEDTLFHGTLEQNIRLAAPEFELDELKRVLERFDLMHLFGNDNDWYDLRLTHAQTGEFTDAEKKSLCIARTICRNAPIHLYSEPTMGLSQFQRNAFRSWVAEQANGKTIFISTSDRSLLSVADRCIYIDSGRLLVDDGTEAGVKKMFAALKQNGS